METPKTVTTPWDAADYIETPEDVVEFLKAALEENDPTLLKEALDVIARAKGTTALAQRAGISLEWLLQASTIGNQEFATLFRIMEAMDLRLDVRAKQANPEAA